ncbi:MAG TPA: tRNA (adenosine(37)-N6)-threonylcarbamoyltransferase complex transferase subunit TsaD [Elusimicrobiota bacterium]|nr:tRNA (adenosine(37)-N6)-threonylcarbamoyltransferase complex transferase subunit TsaD [Elusimicrobiota bacterium]
MKSKNQFRVLGIETSCDETAAAVVEGGGRILSNVVSSQMEVHRPFAGVVPELASRTHVEKAQEVMEEALKDLRDSSGKSFPKILPVDAVAVTVGPGLAGSLLVGKIAAEVLAWVYEKPLIPVNHLESHLLSILPAYPDLEPPFLALVVSGGHTELVHVRQFGKYQVLGKTRDDAAGEAFDKVAKLLGLPYPGGPAVEHLAKSGNPATVDFPRAWLWESWDFSFSGLKTSVLYHLRDNPSAKSTKKKMAHLCASFQAAIVDVLVKKTLAAADKLGLKTIVVGGGVAANSALRESFKKNQHDKKVLFSAPALCTDNAVMVAVAGYYQYMTSGGKNTQFKPRSIEIDPSLLIRNWG